MRPTSHPRFLFPEIGVVALVVAAITLSAVVANTLRPGTAPQPPVIDRIRIAKSRHRLDAFAGSVRVVTYRVSIGRGGAGPKRYEGDRRTPEGEYTIDARHPSDRFHRFLHITYPNDTDRRAFERGVASGSIPRGASIGGDVGIHGQGGGLAQWFGSLVDWTSGCVAVTTTRSTFSTIESVSARS